MTSGKKDMYSDLRGHSVYIATRRAPLEAREAGFLVQYIILHSFSVFSELLPKKWTLEIQKSHFPTFVQKSRPRFTVSFI